MTERSRGPNDFPTRRGAIGTLVLPLAAVSSTQQIGATPPGWKSVDAGGTVSVTAFGAVGDGVADDTAAFQRTIDHLVTVGGGTMLIPAGQFRISGVRYPVDPVAIQTVGAGSTATILEMASPHRALLLIDPAIPGKRMSGARFADFGIAPHPDGRADDPDQIAIDTQGFNAVIFERIAYRGNRRGSVGTLFYTSAGQRLTYQQTFRDLFVSENVGPGCVLRTGGGPGAVDGNTNLIFIDGFWVYANSDMATAFDLSRCTLYTMRNGLIESSAKTGIALGNSGLIESVWLEDIAGVPLRFDHGSGKPGASHNTLRNVYLSGFDGMIDLPPSSSGNMFDNVTGGRFRLNRPDPTLGNAIVNSAAFGEKPTIRQIAGTAVRVKEVSGTRVSGIDGQWQMLYTFTPAGPGSYGFRLVPPDGYRISRLFATAMDGANGVAYPCAIGWPVSEFFVTVPNVNAVVVVAQLSYE